MTWHQLLAQALVAIVTNGVAVPLLSWLVLRRIKRVLGDKPLGELLRSSTSGPRHLAKPEAEQLQLAAHELDPDTGQVPQLQAQLTEQLSGLQAKLDVLARVIAQDRGIG